MRTTEVKKMILRMSGSREFYGYDIHRNLTDQGARVGIGRLYGILSEMREEGLLKDRWESSVSGPRRRVYQMTPKGLIQREKILLEAIKTVHEFYSEYLLSLPPERSAFERIGNILTADLSEFANIAYVTSRITEPIRKILATLRRQVPSARLFVIGQKAELSETEMEEVSFLEGAFQDIPIRDNYLDLLIVTGNITNDCLEECLVEWHRSISEKGKLAILSPTALLTMYKDPLTIGDFVEQFEHPRPKIEVVPDLESLKKKMGEYFSKVDSTSVVHITVVRGIHPQHKTHVDTH